jgi:hypothetical protein
MTVRVTLSVQKEKGERLLFRIGSDRSEKLDWQAEIALKFGLGRTLRPQGLPWSEKKSSLELARV